MYDELEKSEKSKFKNHLESCPVCQAEYKENLSLFQTLEGEEKREISPRWGYYWGNILNQVKPEKFKKRLAWPSLKWGVTFAGFVFCLVLGFFIGRIFLESPQIKRAKGATYRENNSKIALGYYLEDMKPLMVDLANTNFSEKQKNGGPVEKELIKSMLIQTRLLRRRFSERDDPYVKSLLMDMELILMEIDNIVPGDKSSIKSIQELIKNKGIPIQIELIKLKTKKI
jgi:hypothetical protein